jgi:hypothetical protein
VEFIFASIATRHSFDYYGNSKSIVDKYSHLFEDTTIFVFCAYTGSGAPVIQLGLNISKALSSSKFTRNHKQL